MFCSISNDVRPAAAPRGEGEGGGPQETAAGAVAGYNKGFFSQSSPKEGFVIKIKVLRDICESKQIQSPS